jgi:hypothetical protein
LLEPTGETSGQYRRIGNFVSLEESDKYSTGFDEAIEKLDCQLENISYVEVVEKRHGRKRYIIDII